MKKIFKFDDAGKKLRRVALIAIGAFSLSATQMHAQDGSKIFNKIYEKLEKFDEAVDKVTQPGRDLASKVRRKKGELNCAKYILGQALPMEIDQRVNRIKNISGRIGNAVEVVGALSEAGKQKNIQQQEQPTPTKPTVRYVKRAPRGGRD